MKSDDDPIIWVMEHGPYRVEGPVSIQDVDGNELRRGGIWHLCRCGGSRSKPFCDATHGLKGFDGAETASREPAAQRRDQYDADEVVVYDDRARCAHFGQCSDRLAQVFRVSEEPFVDPTAAPADTIAEVVSGCPSGALSYARKRTVRETVEDHAAASVTPLNDGPYRVRGSVQVMASDGTPYEVRERQTLCRCGQSRNKPFCDGSHWYAGFRDPTPAEAMNQTPTIYEWVGGIEVLESLTRTFYADILGDRDELLEPLFRDMDPAHPRHVAAWLAETFGGPQDYTRHRGGYERMVAAHLGRLLTEDQRQRWLTRLVATADKIGLSNDPNFRSAFVAYLEWGTRIAVFNSQPEAQVIEHAPVPGWGWGESAPYTPQPWDDPDAAERGRERENDA